MTAIMPNPGEAVIEPHFVDDLVTLHHGDCLTVLGSLPSDSVDAVVTDPPYGLEFMGQDWDRPWAVSPTQSVGFEGREANLTLPTHRDSRNANCRVCGGRQRGSKRCSCEHPDWDRSPTEDMRAFQSWCEAWARECLRVLKPGGHLLAFGGTRTWHRLASAVEDAGFEVRDSIAWLYGSGFPKSLDVSKAIDKQRDDTDDVRAVCRWLRQHIDQHPTETVKTLAERFGFHPRMVEHWAARDTDSQPTLPTLSQWDDLRDALGFDDAMDGEVYRLNMRKGEPGEAWANRPVTGTVDAWEDRTNYALTSRDGLRRDIPATADAERWSGWGTALKPAFEPIVVGRKPLMGTVATNVTKHGTGAIHVDACRVGDDTTRGDRYNGKPPGGGGNIAIAGERTEEWDVPAGRWPTNVVLSDDQADELDRHTGVLTSGANPTRRGSDKFRDAYGEFKGQEACTAARGADSGGASRFFPTFRYEAKAGSAERPRIGDEAHPTVKPLDLMRWLVRLVTPPGGTVLEPFAGSGTTAEACVIEGFHCIAIEKHAPYLPLIVQRLTKPVQPVLFGGGA